MKTNHSNIYAHPATSPRAHQRRSNLLRHVLSQRQVLARLERLFNGCRDFCAHPQNDDSNWLLRTIEALRWNHSDYLFHKAAGGHLFASEELVWSVIVFLWPLMLKVQDPEIQKTMAAPARKQEVSKLPYLLRSNLFRNSSSIQSKFIRTSLPIFASRSNQSLYRYSSRHAPLASSLVSNHGVE